MSRTPPAADAAFWEEMETPGPQEVTVDGVVLRRGSRVRLQPNRRGDVFDMVLAGRTAVVEGIDEDESGARHVAVVVEDDPGRDLGDGRQPGHRFFFSLDEIEPLATAAPCAPRILVAGIGNVFFADDGFGVAVARRLGEQPSRAGVDVVDFGIRGLDLAYALQERYDAAILVDASQRGERPGTLSVIDELDADGGGVSLDAHGMDPVQVLRLARTIGALPPRVLLVACEPAVLRRPEDDEIVMELSEPVRLAVDDAVRLVESLVEELRAAPPRRSADSGRR